MVRIISCVGEKNGKRKIISSIAAIFCFVTKMMKNKTIILLNLAEYALILANSASQDNIIVK